MSPLTPAELAVMIVVVWALMAIGHLISRRHDRRQVIRAAEQLTREATPRKDTP